MSYPGAGQHPRRTALPKSRREQRVLSSLFGGKQLFPGLGTGVQGCQEEAREGALQRVFLSSPGARPLHKIELGPPERLELPGRVKEMDREKDISCGK